MKPVSGCTLSSAVSPRRKLVFAVGLGPVLLASALIAGGAAAAQPGETAAPGATVAAKWVPRKLNYIYQGFTALYSCDGLQGDVASILKKLGARPDLVVRRISCVRLEGPESSPGVDASFSVLVPVEAADKAAADSAVVMARWERVTLQGSTPLHSDAPGCELIEDAKKRFLPLFTTRNVQYSSDCFPHTESLASAHLTVEVLRPVKPAAH